MANTMTPAQQQQQQAAIEAVLARQKEDARTPKTGGPAPYMPTVGGTPNVSPADKAKYAAEIARKTPQIVSSTRRIQEQPQASTQSQANVMRDYYASRQRAAQAQPTPTKPIAPKPEMPSQPGLGQPGQPGKPMLSKDQQFDEMQKKMQSMKFDPMAGKSIQSVQAQPGAQFQPGARLDSGLQKPPMETPSAPPKPVMPTPTGPSTPSTPTTPQQPAYGGGTGQSGMGMGMAGGFKKGGAVKSYTNKGGQINLGSGRVSTHTPSKKNSNW